MKKILKWISIAVGLLVFLLIAGVVLLPFIFPLEKIKEYAVSKISETIKREVRIEKVSFDIFSGIKLENLYVANRKDFAIKPFISAGSIELRYAFWPLFRRQIIIKEIRLVKPEILIEKNARGEFNFSDLIQPKAQANISAQKPTTKPPFDLLIASFSLKDGKVTYTDYAAKTTNEIKKLNVNVSGFELALLKPVDIKASASVTYQGKEIPLSLAGKVGVNLEKETITIPSLSFSIAGESAFASAVVSSWKKAPQVDLALTTKKLSIDPLLAIFTAPTVEKPKPKPGELTKAVNKMTATIPRNLKVYAKADLENLTFQTFKIDKAKVDLSLSNKKIATTIKEVKIYGGNLTGKAEVDLNASGLAYNLTNFNLTNFDAHPFSNAVVETFLTKLPDYQDLINKIYGTLNISLSLSGRGVEVPDILANTSARGSFTLNNGELKRLKTIDAIADKIKLSSLKQDLKISKISSEFSYKNQIVEAKNLSLLDHDLNLNFDGGIDLKNLKWVEGNRLTLKASPALTKDLPREFNVFRDEKGWVELTFEIKGELKKPIPIPILKKPIETAIEKLKIKIEAKKIEIEERAKTEIASKEEEARKALEEEKRRAEEAAKVKAEEEKKRIEEEAKQKLKEMIKF